VLRHPREPRGLDRREFLQRSAGAALSLSGAGTLLAACGSDEGASPAGTGQGGDGTTTAPFELARRDQPVTLPLFDDNSAVASGLEPEKGPLKIYNWIDYLDKKTVKKFGKEFGVGTEITIFNTMDEAVAKMRSGGTDFDIFFPTVDRLGKLVAAKLVQPLNLDYVPNLEKNIWPQLVDPFYDHGSRYTVPYVIYSTGIGYRTDKVSPEPGTLSNPYDIFWETKYKGRTFLLDDYREAMCMILLRHGNADVNTGDDAALAKVREDLLALTDAVNVKVSVLDYTLVPEGRAWIHQAWSGDFVSAQYYLPKGVDYTVLGYWRPPDGGGMIGSDMMTIPRSAKNPVLAHHFLNFMLDEDNAYANFYNFVGYQPPLTSLNPDRLVADEVVPPHLASCVVRPEDFDKGYSLLELAPEVDAKWQSIWAEFKAGV
jgi:spermidine/putrescine transport system substrate-binding protein